MGKTVKIVIGANFGDEGKGLMTDYFCNELSKSGNTLNVRCNGGAQAGHTVVTPDGRRNVFGHFGAGSFNPHVATYLSSEFILNPIIFCRELSQLRSLGVNPKVYIHKDCRITTPFDMMINQIVERFRGDARHGSCGLGINETIVRHQAMNRAYLTLATASGVSLKDVLSNIRNRWVFARLAELGVDKLTISDTKLLYNNNILNNWIWQLVEMLGVCEIVDDDILQDYDNIVFEGAQGLLLDTDYKRFAPHLTSSKTGSVNPKKILQHTNNSDADIECCYVTRAYFTRHGAGPFPSECHKDNILPKNVVDQTNHTNEFQGELRYGYFDAPLFESAVSADSVIMSNRFNNLRNTLAVTHLDETGGLIISGNKDAVRVGQIDIDVAAIYHSNGNTRAAVSLY